MKSITWMMLIFAALVLTGCGGGQTTDKGTGKPNGKENGPQTKQYPIKGKVIAVNLAKPSVRLDHEDIPELMKAMVMEFSVEDAKVLEGLVPGDQVHGHLKVESDKYIIIHLMKH